MIIKELFNALKAGYELKNSATWKDRQKTANQVVIIIGFLVPFLPKLGVNIVLSQDDILVLAGAVSVILGVVNTLMTAATSKKVGLFKPKEAKVVTEPEVEVAKPSQISTTVVSDIVEDVENKKTNLTQKKPKEEQIGIGD